MDEHPPSGSPEDDPARRAMDRRYELPGTRRHGPRTLPVAPTAPRIPGALRAFNGMPAPEPPPPASPAPALPRLALPRTRPHKDGLTIRDLLIEPSEQQEEGPLAALRAAFARLRRNAREGTDR